jgi:hypothetical protein
MNLLLRAETERLLLGLTPITVSLLTERSRSQAREPLRLPLLLGVAVVVVSRLVLRVVAVALVGVCLPKPSSKLERILLWLEVVVPVVVLEPRGLRG